MKSKDKLIVDAQEYLETSLKKFIVVVEDSKDRIAAAAILHYLDDQVKDELENLDRKGVMPSTPVALKPLTLDNLKEDVEAVIQFRDSLREEEKGIQWKTGSIYSSDDSVWKIGRFEVRQRQ